MRTRITKVAGAALAYPIDLEQVKSHLSITHDAQDRMLAADIMIAHDWAEEYTRRAIATRDYLITRDRFPSGAWELPLGRVTAIGSVQYIDTDGATQTWSSSEYETDLDSDHASRLRPGPSYSWPSTGDYLAAARVTVTAGWDADDVPYTVRQALLFKIGALYGTRVPGDEDPAVIEALATMMLSGWTLPAW